MGGELKNWVRFELQERLCGLISMFLSHHRCHLIFILIKQSIYCALTRILAYLYQFATKMMSTKRRHATIYSTRIGSG